MTAVARRPEDRTCLVLNADHTPLSTWPPSVELSLDQVKACFKGKVTVIETWPGEFFHSPSMQIPIPKVVALTEYKAIYAEPKFNRRSVYLRDRHRCQYCGERFPLPELTLDHLIPRAKGGTTIWTNVLTCCIKCNGIKKDQDANFSGRKGHRASDGRLRPLKTPRRPTTTELLRAGLEFLPNDMRESFGDWLYWNVPLEP